METNKTNPAQMGQTVDESDVYCMALDRIVKAGHKVWESTKDIQVKVRELERVQIAVEGTAMVALIEIFSDPDKEKAKDTMRSALLAMITFGVNLGEEAEKVRRGEAPRVDPNPEETHQWVVDKRAEVLNRTLHTVLNADPTVDPIISPTMGEC